MKKANVLGIAFLCMTILFTGCGSTSKSNGVKEIQEKGKIVLGTSADYPPYEYHKQVNGKDEIVGFDIAIAKAVAEDLGVELEIVDMKFEGLLAGLVANKVDFVVAGMTATEERQKSIDFSKAYYNPEMTVLTRKEGQKSLTKIEAFDHKIIGVQKGSIQEEVARTTFKNSDIKALGKVTDLILELKAGKVDGIVLVEPVAKAYEKENTDLAGTNIRLGSADSASVAIAKGNASLQKAINDTIKRLETENQMDQMITEAIQQSESF